MTMVTYRRVCFAYSSRDRIAGRLGSRYRKQRAHVLNHKQKAERTNWKWQGGFFFSLKAFSKDVFPPGSQTT